MMLRSRSAANSQNVETGVALKPNDDAKRAGKNDENATGEPTSKRRRLALVDINQGIESISIDSTKRTSKRSSKGSSVASSGDISDALPSIKENVEPEVGAPVEAPVEPEVDPCPEFDFDAEVAEKEKGFAVSAYAADIFKYYRSREKLFKVDDYMLRQKYVRPENRSVLIDWMVEMQEAFELNHETLYLAVKLVDLFLSRQDNVRMEEIQTIASAATLIASKFDERSPPLIDDFVYMAEDRITREQLIRMEMKVLKVVGFDLGSPLSYRYLRRYSRVVCGDMQTLTLARFITETSLMFYELCGVSESRLAAGAFLLALKMKDSTATWCPVLHKYSGYREEEIEPLMWELNHMMHVRRTGAYTRLQTVYVKYSHEVFFRSAAVPLLPNKFSARRRIQAPEGHGFGRQL